MVASPLSSSTKIEHFYLNFFLVSVQGTSQECKRRKQNSNKTLWIPHSSGCLAITSPKVIAGFYKHCSQGSTGFIVFLRCLTCFLPNMFRTFSFSSSAANNNKIHGCYIYLHGRSIFHGIDVGINIPYSRGSYIYNIFLDLKTTWIDTPDSWDFLG